MLLPRPESPMTREYAGKSKLQMNVTGNGEECSKLSGVIKSMRAWDRSLPRFPFFVTASSRPSSPSSPPRKSAFASLSLSIRTELGELSPHSGQERLNFYFVLGAPGPLMDAEWWLSNREGRDEAQLLRGHKHAAEGVEQAIGPADILIPYFMALFRSV